MIEREKKTLEQVLKEEKEILTVASGVSMLPCIRPQRDVLYIVRPAEKIEKYDVILYQRKNGAHILHRVIDVKETEYILCGDNQYVPEFCIKDEQILGVLRGFYRGENYIDCRTNRKYCLYVKIWCYPLRLRKVFIRTLNLMRRLWSKLCI